MTSTAPEQPSGGELQPTRQPLVSTAILMKEHAQIRIALAVLETMASRLAGRERISPASPATIVYFLRRFADHCHHAKEEQVLFPALEAAGIRRHGGPIGVMMSEHERGRAMLSALSDAANQIDVEGQRSRFVAVAGEYAALLNAHIAKEENVLFGLAQKALPMNEDARIASAFEEHETESMEPGEHEELEALLRALAHEFLNSGRGTCDCDSICASHAAFASGDSTSASFRSKRCTRKFAERISGLGEAQEKQSRILAAWGDCPRGSFARRRSTVSRT